MISFDDIFFFDDALCLIPCPPTPMMASFLSFFDVQTFDAGL